MSAASMNLAIVLSLIDQSVDAYRVLLREHPLDWGEEATQRQQQAADLLDRAQTLGGALNQPDEQCVFAASFSSGYAAIERLETLRAQIGYDPDEAEDRAEPDREPVVVARLVGGPFHGQTRNLEPVSSEKATHESAPTRIQLPNIAGSEINMVTYLADREPKRGEWTYFYADALNSARSLEASIAMDSPSGPLAKALAHLDNAERELRRETDAGLQAGLMALNEAVVAAQNGLAPEEQDVFTRRRRPVQVLANEMEDRASFDPDWKTA